MRWRLNLQSCPCVTWRQCAGVDMVIGQSQHIVHRIGHNMPTEKPVANLPETLQLRNV